MEIGFTWVYKILQVPWGFMGSLWFLCFSCLTCKVCGVVEFVWPGLPFLISHQSRSLIFERSHAFAFSFSCYNIIKTFFSLFSFFFFELPCSTCYKRSVVLERSQAASVLIAMLNAALRSQHAASRMLLSDRAEENIANRRNFRLRKSLNSSKFHLPSYLNTSNP